MSTVSRSLKHGTTTERHGRGTCDTSAQASCSTSIRWALVEQGRGQQQHHDQQPEPMQVIERRRPRRVGDEVIAQLAADDQRGEPADQQQRRHRGDGRPAHDDDDDADHRSERSVHRGDRDGGEQRRVTAASTAARRRLTVAIGHAGDWVHRGARISATARSRQINTAQASTASAARIMPIHIVRCGVHVIVTVDRRARCPVATTR